MSVLSKENVKLTKDKENLLEEVRVKVKLYNQMSVLSKENVRLTKDNEDLLEGQGSRSNYILLNEKIWDKHILEL